jgi:hypothetical protein
MSGLEATGAFAQLPAADHDPDGLGRLDADGRIYLVDRAKT